MRAKSMASDSSIFFRLSALAWKSSKVTSGKASLKREVMLVIISNPHWEVVEMRRCPRLSRLRMASILNDWGLTWGSHSNNHFDITLTTFAHVAAAAPGKPTALDTHWIWQDGQNLLEDAPQIKDGYLEVPDRPGLGVTLNMERVMEANRLYNQMENHDRDDAMAMQYLIPGWKYDSKKPCLVR